MKVLHVSGYYYPHIGGIEQTARDIVNALSGVEQRVVCFNGVNSTVCDEVDGHPVYRCGAFMKVASQPLSTTLNKVLKGQFKEFAPDVVIFHYPNPFEAHALLKCLKKYPKCKLILWWHLDITKQKILGKLFKGQSERLLKRAERVVATSPNYIEFSPFLSRYKDKCKVIYSCANDNKVAIDGKIIETADKIRAKNAGKIICFAVGRHVEYKGYEYLIKASHLLDDRFKFYIAGEGKLTEKLKSLAAGDNKIEFLGKISDDEVKAYMSACDIYCFPSITRNEAFGLALAESMFFGKPSVTFTIEGSGVNFVSLKDVTGLEVPNRNVEEYAAALKKLADDENLRHTLGNNARERAQSLFAYGAFSQSVKGLIREILGE